jgi:hypothetical protein
MTGITPTVLREARVPAGETGTIRRFRAGAGAQSAHPDRARQGAAAQANSPARSFAWSAPCRTR